MLLLHAYLLWYKLDTLCPLKEIKKLRKKWNYSSFPTKLWEIQMWKIIKNHHENYFELKNHTKNKNNKF